MGHPHRAWAMCVGGAIMLFTVMGLGLNVFSVYQPYIIQLNGFTNAQGSWINTVRSLFVLLGMLGVHWLYQRLGLRYIATFSLGLLSLSYLIFGFAHSFGAYCAGAALSGLGYSWGGMVPLSLLINRWFRDHQAFALGLASAGSGLATILVPTPLTWLIQTKGLSVAFWVESAVILCLTLLVFLLIRNTPEELGLRPYSKDLTNKTPPPEQLPPVGMTARRWKLVLLSVFLIGGPTSLGVSHVGVLYSTEGYPPNTVAALVSTMGLCLILGKIFFGRIVDTLGGRRSNYIIYSVILVSYLLCCLAPVKSPWVAFLAMAFFGLGLPVSNVALSVWARDFGGDSGFAHGLKWSQTIYALGILLCGPVPGFIADARGSYVPAYFLFFLMVLVALCLIAWVYEKTKAGERPNHHPS